MINTLIKTLIGVEQTSTISDEQINIHQSLVWNGAFDEADNYLASIGYYCITIDTGNGYEFEYRKLG